MAHEIARVLRAVAARPWFIHPAKAEEILAVLALRADGPLDAPEAPEGPEPRREGRVAVIPVRGTVMPRADMLSAMSGAASLEALQAQIREAAGDRDVRAIVLDIDSPGGTVDLLPETVALIRGLRRPDRPIVAVANTMTASAAYWLATAADEIVASPSATVGSIGVYVMHQDVTAALAREGVRVNLLREGARKVEANPFEPLSEAAREHLQDQVRRTYQEFVSAVAEARGVSPDVVSADPEAGGPHMGGGRAYKAEQARALGMVDRVEPISETIARLSRPRLRDRRRRLATT